MKTLFKNIKSKSISYEIDTSTGIVKFFGNYTNDEKQYIAKHFKINN